MLIPIVWLLVSTSRAARRAPGRTTLALFLVLAASGCGRPRTNAFEIIDHREGGDASRFRETFDAGTFDVGPTGNYDIVLVNEQFDATDPSANIVQTLHLRTFWRSIPGTTVADKTQINGSVSYYIVSGELGQAYEGAGSIFVSEDRDGDKITGTLDLARLKPVRQLAASADLFERVDISGRFTATRDRKRTQQLVHEMNRRFGPRPPQRP